MKVTVYFKLGDVLECSNVRDSHKFWRYVSKYCKRVNNRVIAVIKEV